MDGFLPLAIDELRMSDLLEPDNAPAALGDIGRREMLRKLAVGGAAAMLVPAIATLTANPAYAQTGGARCAPCSNTQPCAPGLECLDGKGGAGFSCVDPALCIPKNSPCVNNCDCCSGDCKPGLDCG
jgi:hypothetical protein